MCRHVPKKMTIFHGRDRKRHHNDIEHDKKNKKWIQKNRFLIEPKMSQNWLQSVYFIECSHVMVESLPLQFACDTWKFRWNAKVYDEIIIMKNCGTFFFQVMKMDTVNSSDAMEYSNIDVHQILQFTFGNWTKTICKNRNDGSWV